MKIWDLFRHSVTYAYYTKMSNVSMLLSNVNPHILKRTTVCVLTAASSVISN